jgi:asparagine synthase (glutamine-hydrolysing)
VDLNSMCQSLEVRVPFLDHRVVNFAFQLPSKFKIDGTFKKKIVQDAFRDFLPKELYKRPKHGFEVPLLNWFKTDLYDKIFNYYLHPNFIQEQNIFEWAEVEKLRKKLLSNSTEDSTATIWALVVFQHWYKKYML